MFKFKKSKNHNKYKSNHHVYDHENDHHENDHEEYKYKNKKEDKNQTNLKTRNHNELTKVNKHSRENNDTSYQSESFTYFIPAPPQRNTGYREKDFDTIFKTAMEHGISLKILKTNAINTGIWVFSILSGKKEDFESFYQDMKIQEHAITGQLNDDLDFRNLIERE